MFAIIDRKLLIEKESKFLEEIIINYILVNNDKSFFIKNKIINIFIHYKNLLNKILVFISKYQQESLDNLIFSDVVNIYDRDVLNNILNKSRNNNKCNPNIFLKRLAYLNSLLFLYYKIYDTMENYDLSDTENNFSDHFKCIFQDFENRFDQYSENDTIDSKNLVEKFDKIFMKNTKTLISGFDYLDMITRGGFNAGDLIICAARPGAGKTTFYINLIANNIDDLTVSGKKILCVTPDMSPKYLYYRLIACSYNIDIDDVLKLDKQELLDYIKTFPIKITETNIYERIEELLKVNINQISAVVIDYIQAIKCNSGLGRNLAKHEQLGFITIELKKLAKKYGITLIFLAQLSRESERMGMGNGQVWIKDSGYLEQEADLIFVLNKSKNESCFRLFFEVIKNRHGGLGRFHHKFDPSRFRIH